MELFYSVPYDGLEYESRDSVFVAEFSVRFELEGESGRREDATIYKQARVRSFVEAQEAQRAFVDGFSIVVAPGGYALRMTIAQPTPTSTGGDTVVFEPIASFADSLLVPALGERPALSLLQLAAGVAVDSATGGLSVIPNPTRRYSADGLDRVYVYFEAYNLSPESDSYQVRTSVLSRTAEPETLVQGAPTVKPLTGDAVGSVVGVSVAGLAPGPYAVDLEVTELPSGASARRQAEFVVAGVERGPGGVVPGLELTELEKRYYRSLEYVATRRELAYYNTLSDSGKEGYLASFWNRHNLTEFARRMETAQRYQTARTPGLETDRGRVYVKYGEPDQVDNLVIEVDRSSREYWHYYNLGYTFVFIDVRGDNNYRLAWTDSPDEPSTGLEHLLTEDEEEMFE